MSKKGTVELIIATASGIVANEKIRKTILGTYSDGSARSLPDCLDGEILSPKDRERILYGKKIKRVKKKKKKFKNKKYKYEPTRYDYREPRKIKFE